jgi:hypothetical protein
MVKNIAIFALIVSGAAAPTAAQTSVTPYDACMNAAWLRYSQNLQPCYAIPSNNAENINKKAMCQQQAAADYSVASFECRKLL